VQNRAGQVFRIVWRTAPAAAVHLHIPSALRRALSMCIATTHLHILFLCYCSSRMLSTMTALPLKRIHLTPPAPPTTSWHPCLVLARVGGWQVAGCTCCDMVSGATGGQTIEVATKGFPVCCNGANPIRRVGWNKSEGRRLQAGHARNHADPNANESRGLVFPARPSCGLKLL